MKLFIDTISSLANIMIFDKERKIIDNISWIVKWNESSTLIPQIDDLLKKNNIEYKDLEDIVIVNGPGSFTWVRTTVLAANSINYIIKKNMTPVSYFELFNTYPIIKSSSKRDCFVKLEKDSKIEIIPNDELLSLLKEKWITKVYWEANNELFPEIQILENLDYSSIIKNIELKNLKQIEALYIKKPNIS